MAGTKVLRSEWTKIRSVHSTVWTLGLALFVTVALGLLISILTNNDYDSMSKGDQLRFDPTNTGFAGMYLGQLAMIVFGVLVVSNEYSTGMIRVSLAAVPQRATFFVCKVLVATVLAFVVSLVTAFASFFLGQAALGDHSAAIGDPGVLRAVIGAALYMTLIAMFSMGIAAILRSPMLSLGILMPFFFLISNILGNVSATKKVGQYLPDQAGSKITQVVAPLDDDAPYGPWGGLGIMVIWVVLALIVGYVLLRKRDA
ncbi:ABC transporter permease subunit [Streptomyces tsukubensis]|uniref:ABC transporter permease n=1 Tax=Streptomyces tsukubensis TaxID=83656 RepID=A0A1V4A0X7_9ACTN|nr:ABC transporter permease subunit [Streptomyces tsukubensis]OON72007.1 ABC transporter permease [Streptomyces tsukubensis]QFR95755.1 ABC transporter permease subunit [Streptomyces tsukubensis]